MNTFIPMNLLSVAEGQIAPNSSISGTLAAMSVAQNLQSPHGQAKQQKKLYVGNITQKITETELIDFVNKAFEKAGLESTDGSGLPPVVAANMRLENAYAFVEFRTTKDATVGLRFDGIQFRGMSLRFRRPKDYVPMTSEEMEARTTPQLMNIVSTNVEDTPDKIFIGGLPQNFDEQEVKSLLSTFGQLKSFNLVRDTVNGTSKRYAFCEYVDPSVTDKACEAFNGMSVNDGAKTLVVQRANTNAKPQIYQESPEVDEDVNSLANTILNFSIPIANIFSTIASIANLSASSTDALKPTKTLLILNAIDVTVPFDDESYYDLIEDMRSECSRFGKILDIRVTRSEYVENEDGPTGERDLDFGKIFIDYEEESFSEQAQKELSGRKYNGRMIITSFYSEEFERMSLTNIE